MANCRIGRFVALIRIGRVEGHVNRFTGGERMRPQNGKNIHFLVKSRPRGAKPLTDFYICWGLLYAQLSYISVLHLRWFALQATELLLRNHASVIYPEFFHAPCRKNYALDRKTIGTFLMVSTSSITMQSLGRSYNARRLQVQKCGACHYFFCLSC